MGGKPKNLGFGNTGGDQHRRQTPQHVSPRRLSSRAEITTLERYGLAPYH